MNTELTMIHVDELYSHPENPRKDLGDLSELTESIKKNGVMQNLTVIPGHYDADVWSDEGYTLIIGHRRCAAAKAAGLTKLPCRIVFDMDRKEQLCTMLEENMQRNDLTVYEQAQSFQLMLDLGETEESIADKTGFSRTTVKHRINIAKLDQELLKQKEDNDSYQMSLKDLYLLESIDDVDTRNRILRESSNSSQLSWKISNEITLRRRDKNRELLVALCKEAGIKKAPKELENNRYQKGVEELKRISFDKEPPKRIKNYQDAYYYIPSWGSDMILLQWKKKSAEELEAETEQKKRETERKNAKKRIETMYGQMIKEMKQFVTEHARSSRIFDGKKVMPYVNEGLFDIAVKCEMYLSKEYLVTELYSDKSWYELSDDEKEKAYEIWDKCSFMHKLFVAAVYGMKSKSTVNYYGSYDEKIGKALINLYDLLEPFGFTWSDDEFIEIADGTHELYRK